MYKNFSDDHVYLESFEGQENKVGFGASYAAEGNGTVSSVDIGGDYGNSFDTAFDPGSSDFRITGTIDSLTDEDWILLPSDFGGNGRFNIFSPQIGFEQYQLAIFFGGAEISRVTLPGSNFREDLLVPGEFGDGYQYYLIVNNYPYQLADGFDYTIVASGGEDNYGDSLDTALLAETVTEETVFTGTVTDFRDVISFGVDSSRAVRISIEYEDQDIISDFTLSYYDDRYDRASGYYTSQEFSDGVTWGEAALVGGGDLLTDFGLLHRTSDLQTWFLNITHWGGLPSGTPYTVTIETIEDDHPSFVSTDMNELVIGGPAQTALMNYTGDQDIFVIEVTERGSVSFDISGTSYDNQPEIKVYQESGRGLADTDLTEDGIQSYFFNEAGTYYLRLGVGEYNAGGDSFSIRAYQSTDAVGDTIATAASLTLGTAQVVTIDHARDMDLFSFSVSGPQRLSFDLASEFPGFERYAANLYLYNNLGELITQIESFPNTATIYEIASGGDYYLGVEAREVEFTSGSFTSTLTVSQTSEAVNARGGVNLSNRGDVVRISDVSGNSASGGAGHDTIYGTGSLSGDSIGGGAGDDIIFGGGGNDLISGGDGNDTITLSGGGALTNVSGGAGDDLIQGAGGRDSIDGGSGSDRIFGGDNNDTFSENFSGDYTYSADALVFETDIYDGGAGVDAFILNVSNIGGVSNDIISVTGEVTGTDAFNLVVTAIYSEPSFTSVSQDVTVQTTISASNIEEFGTHSSSTVETFSLTGAATELGDLILMTGSDVTVNGLGGADFIALTDGNDIADGGTGFDTIFGNGGDDTLSAGADGGVLYGGDGNDTFIIGSGETGIYGGNGEDIVVFSGDLSDYTLNLYSPVLNDNSVTSFRIYDAAGATITINAVEIFQFNGVTYTYGEIGGLINSRTGPGNDVVNTGLPEFGPGFAGLGGDDIINGSEGNDAISGDYDESRTADPSISDLRDFGNDQIFGNGGNDQIFGGPGDDLIDGGEGDDRMLGGEGSDRLIFGAGGDLYDGGFGIDTLDSSAHANGLIVDLFNLINETGDASNDVFARIENIVGTDFDDVFYGTPGANELQGGSGDDALTGRQGNDTIDGGAGLDVAIFAGNYNDYTLIDLPSGEIQISHDSSGTDGTDTLIDVERARFADQEIDLSARPEQVPKLTEADDTVTFGDGANVINARGGNDTINAGGGNDIVNGQTGADVIYGESGDDSLFGDSARAIAYNSAEGELFRAYQTVFGRAPDAGGFNAFMTELRLGNLDQEAITTEFVASAEFQNRYGQLSNSEFIELLYNNVLPGNQDPVGRAAFTASLDEGTQTRVDVVSDFANSRELVQLTAVASAAFATNVIIHPAEAQVFRIYQAVFLRDPDEGGFTAFTNSIQAGVLSVEDITAEFMASAEFQDSYGALDNAAFVELLFTNVLPGNADAAGRADYTTALNEGLLTRAAMVAEFVESFEFVQRTAADATAFVAGVFSTSGDTLVGGTGADILFGGRGADLFVYDTSADGADTILDFTVGTDTLDLGSNAAFDSFAEIIAAATQVGQDTVFDFGGGNTLTLDNTVLTDLTEAEFGFGSAGSSASSSAAAKPPTIPVMEVAEHSAALDRLTAREEPDWVIDALI